MPTPPMSTSVSTLIQVAQALAGGQSYPAGALYMVATPIGNLADITLRALYVLDLVDLVACEDTRNTGQLLKAYGLHKPLFALHQHNEREASQAVLARLQAGERVAYVSDAGTPAVSDPGAKLAASLVQQGLRVMPVPGASSITALLSAAGVAHDAGRFEFVGFLPTKGALRKAAWLSLCKALLNEPSTARVLLESPHRIELLCAELAQYAPEHSITIGRELTKQFEQITTLKGSECPTWLAAKPEHAKGEFALVIHPLALADKTTHTADEGLLDVALSPQRLLSRLMQEMPLKSAVAVCVDVTGLPKNQLYDLGLTIKATASATTHT